MDKNDLKMTLDVDTSIIEKKVEELKAQVAELEGKESTLTDKIAQSLFGMFKEKKTHVLKQFEDDKMVAIEALYIVPEVEIDSHGESYTVEECEKMVSSFNKAVDAGTIQPSLFHTHKTATFEIGKACMIPFEVEIGGHIVQKNQPLVEIIFKNEKAYELRKKGSFGVETEGALLGVSIGAMARYEEDSHIDTDKAMGLAKSHHEDDDKKKKKPKMLADITFDHKGGHLAYTDLSQGGAASYKNVAVMLKAEDNSLSSEVVLTENQKNILEEIGEEFTPLDKAAKKAEKEKGDNFNSSSPDSNDNGTEADEEKINKGKENDMSKELEKALADLEAEKAAIAAENEAMKAELEASRKEAKSKAIDAALSDYSFDAEVAKGLTDVLMDLEDEKAEAVKAALEALNAKVKSSEEVTTKEGEELTKEVGDSTVTEAEKSDFKSALKAQLDAEQSK